MAVESRIVEAIARATSAIEQVKEALSILTEEQKKDHDDLTRLQTRQDEDDSKLDRIFGALKDRKEAEEKSAKDVLLLQQQHSQLRKEFDEEKLDKKQEVLHRRLTWKEIMIGLLFLLLNSFIGGMITLWLARMATN